MGKQQDINRAMNAGKFCEKHNITDFDDIGILKSSIYALSRPANADVADKIFNDVKRKNLPNTVIERLIDKAKSITVDKEPDDEEEVDEEENAEKIRQKEKVLYSKLAE